MGRLIGTTTQYSFLPGHNFQNGYTYDAASNRKTLTAPDGSTNTYNYDTLNRLSTLTNSLTGQFGFGYDALSPRTQLTRPNGINTNYSYDSVSRLLSVLHQAGSTTLDGASYNYDYADNRTSKTNFLNNITEGYTSDPIYQLTQVTQGASTTESYSYAAVGNRLSSLGVNPYSYNTSNELTATPSGSYTYDNTGNTLTDPSGKSYTWDFENRLVSAVVPGTGTVTFKYDPFGRRIQKSGPLGTTNYLYDGETIVEEVDGSINVLARYAGEPRWDGPLSMLRGGATSYYEQDGVNSVVSVTNSNGALVQTYTYDSYGTITASAGTLSNPFRFTAREFDQETGIYEYRARYYDQNAGRFISEDQRKFAGGSADFYSYVRNNPPNFRDPEGKVPVWGWWCGPNWTGGFFEPYSWAIADETHRPWGDTDRACMNHDICYFICRQDHPCSKADRAKCMRECDASLLTDAPYSFIGNLVSSAVWFGNKDPDTGENDRNCPKCQKDSAPPPRPQKPCHGWGCVDNR